MHLKDARVDFLKGYFSTHDRRQKTKTAYHSDLAQFQQFAGKNTELLAPVVRMRYKSVIRNF